MKIFSPLLKRQMKDCILSLFWPKKDIYSFFKDCSLPKQTLRHIEDWDNKGLHRPQMVEIIFDSLGNQADNGTFHFNLMLDQLSNWSHFDDYWFNKMQKLDLADAKQKIAALSKAKTQDVDKIKKREAKKKEEVQKREERFKSLEEMRMEFYEISMNSKTPQNRGYAFEKFLSKMARFYNLKVTDSFKIQGTQIDGSFKFEGEHYNIEAKWHDRHLSDEPLMAFCHKQEINMHGRGVFISINGFTSGAVGILERAGAKKTVLMDGEDITLILQEMITLPEVLDKKVQAAQTRGAFYINPITGKEKITS